MPFHILLLSLLSESLNLNLEMWSIWHRKDHKSFKESQKHVCSEKFQPRLVWRLAKNCHFFSRLLESAVVDRSHHDVTTYSIY